MIDKFQQDLTKQDIEILIKYGKMNRRVEHLVSVIQSADKRLICDSDDNEKFVNVSDVYYIESFDKRVFVYCEKVVYHTKLRLYQLMDSWRRWVLYKSANPAFLTLKHWILSRH